MRLKDIKYANVYSPVLWLESKVNSRLCTCKDVADDRKINLKWSNKVSILKNCERDVEFILHEGKHSIIVL